MATTETYRNDNTGLTGLFNSMMGFTAATTLYTMRLMFTNPVDFADRLRVSMDNVSNALMESIRGKKTSDQTAWNAARVMQEDMLNDTREATESASQQGAEENLTGRKR